MAGFLRRAAREAPLCIILEDVHLADDAALQLFEVMAHSIAEMRLCIIATCCTQESHERQVLQRALDKGLPHVSPLELGGLSWQEVRVWLDSVSAKPVPEHVAKALHFSTEGHPSLLENLMDHLPDEWRTALPASELTGAPCQH